MLAGIFLDHSQQKQAKLLCRYTFQPNQLQKEHLVKHLLWLLVTLSALVGCQSTSSKSNATKIASNANLEKVTEVEGITEYKLSNGLRVLLFPDPSQAKVTINTTYFVGSRHEGYGEAGMAHLLEHMVFKGTDTRPGIWKALTDRGARFNGTTWTDRTNYYETLPATKENLEFAIAMEADRMVNSKIDPKDLAKEFSVVRNEFEMGENSPIRVLLDRLHSTSFDWHNYGKSTIGNKSDIEKVPVENLKAFYKKYYQPDNAMLVVAGRFDEKTAKSLIKKHFGAIPEPKRKLQATYTVEPKQDGERMVTLRRTGEVPAAGVLYKIPQGSHEDFVAIDALSYVLASEPNGILYRDFVKQGDATAVYATTFNWHDPGTFWSLLQLKQGSDPTKAVTNLFNKIESLKLNQITDKEVDRFKKEGLSNIRLANADSQRIAIDLSNWASLGDWRLYFVYRDRLEKLTTKDVREAYKKYIMRSNRTAGVFIPTKNPERIADIKAPSVEKLVDGYKGRKTLAKGEVFDPSFDNLMKRTKYIDLRNGMKLAVLAKKTRGETIQARMVMRYGNEKSLQGKDVAEFMLPSLLMRGSKEKDFAAVKDRLVELDSKISGSLQDPGVAAFSFTTKKASLKETLALFAELLSKPRFDETEFKVYKDEILTSLKNSLSDPQAIARSELEQAMNPFPEDSIHHVSTTEESIKAVQNVKLADLKKLYDTQYTTKFMTASLVGDFDEGSIGELVEGMIPQKTSRVAMSEIVKPYTANRSVERVVNTPDKKGAMVTIGHTLKLNTEDPRYHSSKIAGFVFGQSSSSRLNQSLRQTAGIAYGAWGGFSAAAKGDFGQFYATAICGPENAGQALSLIRQEMNALLAKGLTEEELKRAKQGYAEQEKTRFTNDATLASVLEYSLRSDLDLEFYQKRAKKVASLKLEKINSDIKSMIEPSKLAKVVAADLEKAGNLKNVN